MPLSHRNVGTFAKITAQLANLGVFSNSIYLSSVIFPYSQKTLRPQAPFGDEFIERGGTDKVQNLIVYYWMQFR